MTLKGQNALRDVDRASFGVRHENLKEDRQRLDDEDGIAGQRHVVASNKRQSLRPTPWVFDLSEARVSVDWAYAESNGRPNEPRSEKPRFWKRDLGFYFF